MRTSTLCPLLLACALGLSLSTTTLAQGRGHDHAGHAAAAAASQPATPAGNPAELPLVDAEVRRVDSRNNKLSLRHQEIPNLDMPPMTMVFEVADPALLEGLSNGDKVRVTVDEINGKYTVMSLQR